MDNQMSEPTQTNRKKSRRRNGDGNTYRHKNGWRTVISHKGHTVTAMGRSEQESRRLIKLELPLEWQGSLIVDDKPILSTDSQDCMLWADVKRSNNGGVDLNVRQLLWRGGTPNSNRPLG